MKRRRKPLTLKAQQKRLTVERTKARAWLLDKGITQPKPLYPLPTLPMDIHERIASAAQLPGRILFPVRSIRK